MLIQNDWIDKDFIGKHALGFEEFKKSIEVYSPERIYLGAS